LDNPLFAMKNVSFYYHPREPIFKDISIDIKSGEAVCLLGANGSGKSTLLKMFCGLVFPVRGHFEAFGQKINETSMEDDNFSKQYFQRVGFVFQNSDVQLFTTRVGDEIAFGPLQLGLGPAEVQQRVEDVLDMLKIRYLEDRSPHRLSGGEKKRVAVASVLALNPEVLILDEPTNGLDPRTQRSLVELLLELNKIGRTIIISTHNLELAHTLSRRALVISEDHKIVYDGSTREALDNRDLLIAVNLIDEYSHRHGEVEHTHLYKHG
jgi:cobalt/nickel transport system ATP-binding protein